MDISKINNINIMPIEFIDFEQPVHPERLWCLARIKDKFGDDYKDYVILDLGCGAHKSDESFFGVDVRELSGVNYVSSIDDMSNLDDGFANAIVSRHSLEHLVDTVKTLNEWVRVLQLDGKIIIILPDHEFIDTMDPMLSGNVHMHAFTRESFRNLVTALGFTVELLETVIEGWSFGAVINKP